jgi:Family of unknown function (DUF6636)
MPRVILLASLFVVALTPTSAGAVTSFHSPSGNIRCQIPNVEVRCDITKRSWRPTPKPNSCEFDWGSVGVSRKGKGHFLCVSDATEPGGELAYGDSITRFRFRCESLSSGMRCVNTRNGHGFKVSRERYRFF